MSCKKYWKPVIDDVQNEGCSDNEKEHLLDMFEYLMREVADTRIRKAWFELKDFLGADRDGIAPFALTMERYTEANAEQWIGYFESGGKRLRVFGTLDPEK